MAPPRAVLLDLWHTMAYLAPADEERYMALQLETVARVVEGWPRSPRGRHPPLHEALRAAEQIREEAVHAAARGISTPLAVQALHAARRLGRQARPLELIQALSSLVARTSFSLCPGILETLADLQRRGFRLGVISNTIGEPGEALQQTLDRAGVGEYVEAWAFSDQLPWTKPAPEIFWHCLGMLGTPRERAVHVGDGWSDLVGARAAGLRAGILYTGARNYGPSYRQLFAPERPELLHPDFALDRLIDLPTLAEKILAE
ncbi:MAG TPA: HAD family hydrolase [Thermoplasmata archaeon]|nr:HAD family hydrolase [Thermoplasmata archaeon]